MIRFLERRFVTKDKTLSDKKVRERYGILAATLGVICNLFLFIVKLVIGFLMNSVAIMSDAFNNLSDMGSSVVSAVGVKLSNQRADKEHPFGHGRMEYIAALIVAFIIMLIGWELLKTSADKIWHPQKPEFSPILLGILALSVLVKVWMYFYNRYIGKKINSSVILATARDSINDVLSTGVVIISAVFGAFVDFPLDGIMGTLVSLIVLYSGFSIAKDTVSVLLGTMPDPALVRALEERILAEEEIVGTHDLIVHDYGPGRVMASVHAEVPDTADVVKIHESIDRVEKEISKELDVHIVIHMDPITVNCERTDAFRQLVLATVKSIDESFGIHDFRMTDGEDNINLIFDLEIPCGKSGKQKEELVSEIKRRLSEHDEKLQAVIQVDDIFR